MDGALEYVDDGVERFRCHECLQVMPAIYRASELPYGWEAPVCVMCVRYWDHLQTLDEQEDEEEED